MNNIRFQYMRNKLLTSVRGVSYKIHPRESENSISPLKSELVIGEYTQKKEERRKKTCIKMIYLASSKRDAKL